MSALDTDYKVLINVETQKNKFVHILNQAEREDQVLCHIFVQNKTLLQWGDSANSEGQSYVEILNKNIPSKAFEIKQSCQ
jgi:hypothetical protein